MNSEKPRAREWNASSYDRLGAPLTERGVALLGRLELSGDETVLDAGCGTGRVTAALLDRLPGGQVVALDGSASMVDQARALLGHDSRAGFAHADLTENLPFGDGAFDAIISTSTLHWVHDHASVFREFARVLKPGGHLEIDCGGEGNIARVQAALDDLGIGWSPWNFRGPQDAEPALFEAGFSDVRAWLGPDPVQVSSGELEEYLRTVILGSHLERLSTQQGDEMIAAVTRAMPDGLVDYMRLNVSAVRE